jgi:hypothetical protein
MAIQHCYSLGGRKYSRTPAAGALPMLTAVHRSAQDFDLSARLKATEVAEWRIQQAVAKAVCWWT